MDEPQQHQEDLDFMTVEEAARLLRVSPKTVRAWLGQGRLRGFKLTPKVWRIRREDFRAFIAAQAQAEEVYEIVGQDALAWLEHAKTLKLSADVILQELIRISPQSQVLPGVRERKLAYVRSFMLLTGLAFENLIKGIFIARNPRLVDRKKLDAQLWSAVRKGHGISTLANQVTSLHPEELNLLSRLEEALIWAGRYPIPMNSTQYFQTMLSNKVSLNPAVDSELINSLFERLSAILEMERSERLERPELSRPALAAPKAAVLKRLRAMQAEGLSLQAIADRLNKEGVLTLSGKGQWQQGTIGNLLAQQEEGAP
jgi:excisionase family DNA binding protein